MMEELVKRICIFENRLNLLESRLANCHEQNGLRYCSCCFENNITTEESKKDEMSFSTSKPSERRDENGKVNVKEETRKFEELSQNAKNRTQVFGRQRQISSCSLSSLTSRNELDDGSKFDQNSANKSMEIYETKLQERSERNSSKVNEARKIFEQMTNLGKRLSISRNIALGRTPKPLPRGSMVDATDTAKQERFGCSRTSNGPPLPPPYPPPSSAFQNSGNGEKFDGEDESKIKGIPSVKDANHLRLMQEIHEFAEKGFRSQRKITKSKLRPKKI